MFELHKKVAGMGHVEDNEDESTMKDCFFALEVGDDFIHGREFDCGAAGIG